MRGARFYATLFPLVVLTVFPLVVFWQISFMQFTMKWDMMEQYFPFRYFIGNCFQQGNFPWWNPHINLGYPFHADPQSACWYPVTWLLAWNGYSLYDLHIEFIVHIILAGMGVFLMLKNEGIATMPALLFSWCYQTCGFFIGNAQHFTYVISAAWIPWVFWGFLRLWRNSSLWNTIPAGLSLHLLLTGGYPSLFIITLYLLFMMMLCVWVAEKRWTDAKKLCDILLHTTIALSMTIVLSAGYLTSFAEVRNHITRGAGVSLEQALYGAFPPQAAISLLLPLHVAQKQEHILSDISMLNSYVGLLSLVFFLPGLCIKYQLRWFWLFMGIFCFLAALGDASPVRTWLYHHVPLMNTFRFPGVFRLFFILAILMIAAQGLDCFLKANSHAVRIVSLISLFGLAAFLTIKLLNSLIYYKSIETPPFWDYSQYHRFLTVHSNHDIFLIQSIIQIGIVLLLAIVLFATKSYMRQLALFAVVFTDMFLSAQLNMNATVVSNRRVNEFQKALVESAVEKGLCSLIPLNAMHTYDNRLYPSYANHAILLHTISAEGYNPFLLKLYEQFERSTRRYQHLSKPLFSIICHPDSVVTVDICRPTYFQIRASLLHADTLIFQQIYYPRWNTLINENHISLSATNDGLMQIALEKGAHAIVIRYETDLLLLLLLIQIAGYLLLVLIMMFFPQSATRRFLLWHQNG